MKIGIASTPIRKAFVRTSVRNSDVATMRILDTGRASAEVALGGPVRLAPAAPGIDWSAGAFAGLSTRDEQRGGGVLAALRDFRIFDGDAAGDLWSSLTTAARRGELSRPESAESHLLDWSIDVAPDIELVEASPATAISGA